jgi:hypothetical protein
MSCIICYVSTTWRRLSSILTQSEIGPLVSEMDEKGELDLGLLKKIFDQV